MAASVYLYCVCFEFFQTVIPETKLNPLSAKFIKWSNTLKQIVSKLPTICLSVFDHFSGLALKGLRKKQSSSFCEHELSVFISHFR